MNSLLTLLATIQPGEITDTTTVETLLASGWHELIGDDGGMEGNKLIGRMEDVVWQPPILSFVIERHGGTVMGSSRAELQRWQINVEKKTAHYEVVGHRQLRPMQARLDVEPLVEEIVGLILGRMKNERLKWHSDGSVKVLIGKIIPAGSAAKQTLAGQRKRFRMALTLRLSGHGWTEIGLHAFQNVKS